MFDKIFFKDHLNMICDQIDISVEKEDIQGIQNSLFLSLKSS